MGVKHIDYMLVHQSEDLIVTGCTNTNLWFDCDSWSCTSSYVFILGGEDTH